MAVSVVSLQAKDFLKSIAGLKIKEVLREYEPVFHWDYMKKEENEHEQKRDRYFGIVKINDKKVIL